MIHPSKRKCNPAMREEKLLSPPSGRKSKFLSLPSSRKSKLEWQEVPTQEVRILSKEQETNTKLWSDQLIGFVR
jgi:hypothetical protein